MTTVAWDGTLLCVDSRTVGGHIAQKWEQKLFVFTYGPYRAIAASGYLANVQVVIDWIRGETNRPQIPENDSVRALAIDENGECWEWCSDGHGRIHCGAPESIGSGSAYAMGAMLAGANAWEAIEIASKLDTHTGGDVQCYDSRTGQMVSEWRMDW